MRLTCEPWLPGSQRHGPHLLMEEDRSSASALLQLPSILQTALVVTARSRRLRPTGRSDKLRY